MVKSSEQIHNRNLLEIKALVLTHFEVSPDLAHHGFHKIELSFPVPFPRTSQTILQSTVSIIYERNPFRDRGQTSVLRNSTTNPCIELTIPSIEMRNFELKITIEEMLISSKLGEPTITGKSMSVSQSYKYSKL